MRSLLWRWRLKACLCFLDVRLAQLLDHVLGNLSDEIRVDTIDMRFVKGCMYGIADGLLRLRVVHGGRRW
jgi:hypothetical protein